MVVHVEVWVKLYVLFVDVGVGVWMCVGVSLSVNEGKCVVLCECVWSLCVDVGVGYLCVDVGVVCLYV